ncbi:MAG: GYD domain-containing protein [Candidatus Methylomirabilia bacterium]
MPKYLFQASYTAEGAKGLLKDGGSKRRAVVDDLTKALGGRLEAFYYAFGETDVFGIIDAPDNVTTAAVSLAVNASGAVHVKTTVLLTPEEMDQATKKTISYRPPGQ